MGNSTSSNPELSHFPPEITAEIFNFACDDHRQHVHNAMNDVQGNYMARYRKENGGGRVTGPVTLSQVCRAWKDFVYSTPVLWDTLFVYVPQEGERFGLNLTISSLERSLNNFGRPGPTYNYVAIQLSRWLDRSANCPVTVKIGGPYFPAALEPLLSCSERWKDIDIYCPENHADLVYARMEQVVKGPLPLLESFVCRPNRCIYPGPRVHPTLSIEAAKKLTKITLFPDVPLSFSRPKIEVGRWCGFTTSEIIDDLAVMNNIRECALYDLEADFITRSIPPLRLSQLENLELHHLSEFSCDYLIPFLELPLLRRFLFSNGYKPRTKASARPTVDHSKGGMDILPLLLSLILRSSTPCLQSLNLKIYANTVQADILLDILRLSPTLQHIDVTLVGFQRGTLASVSNSQSALFAGDLVVLESLTSYCLNIASLDSDSVEHAALLKYLTLPALKDLRVVFPRQKISSTAEKPELQMAFSEVENLIDRSKCSLKSLKLETHADIPETQLLNLLTRLPTLECLQLEGYRYDVGGRYAVPDEMKFVVRRSLFELLLPPSRTSAGTVHLPKLREMIIEGIILANMDEVFNALEFRWKGDEDRGIQRLTRVGIYCHDNAQGFIEESEQKRYMDLRLQGMDIVFRRQS